MEEEWRDVKGYEGRYQVSSLGNIRSLHSYGGNHCRLLTPVGNGTGYLKVALSNNGLQKQYLVHRLVAQAFIDNPNNYDYVNHKDENKTNNRADNLEWCTKSYNSIYYLNFDKKRKIEYANRFRDKDSGEMLTPMIKRIPRKYLSKVIQKDLDGNFIKIFNNVSEVRIEYGFPTADITSACQRHKGRGGKSHGYRWEFAE